jgi:hypothetical protein
MVIEAERRRSVNKNPQSDFKKPSVLRNLRAVFSPPFTRQELVEQTQKLIFPQEKKLSRIKYKLREKSLSSEQKAEQVFDAIKARAFVWRAEQNIMIPTKPEYQEGFAETFMEMAKDPSVLFIVISKHTGYPDAMGTGIINRDLTELANRMRPPEKPLLGFRLTVASSLQTAHQNLFPQQILIRGKEVLEKRYLTFLEAYTREKDVEKYKLNPRTNWKYAINTEKILEGIDDKGLAYYVEGNREGGRRIKEGENAGQIKGTQEIDWGPYDMLIDKAQSRFGRKVALIFVTSDGASDIMDPDNNSQLTPKAKEILFSPKFLLKRPQESMLTVRVDVPVFYNEWIYQIREKVGREITIQDKGNEVGKRISRGLSPDKQGYYKDK